MHKQSRRWKVWSHMSLAVFCAVSAIAGPMDEEEAAARQAAETYLEQLTRGEWTPALEMIDYEQLASILGAQRVALTGEPATEALFRRELHPARLRQVLRSTHTEIPWRGMTWRLNALRKISVPVKTYEVSYERRSDANAHWEKERFLVLRRGTRWRVLPVAIEATTLSETPMLVTATEAPATVRAAGDAFWSGWQIGALDDIYETTHPQLRAKITLLNFLERGADVLLRLGRLREWALDEARPDGPRIWRLAYTLTGDRDTLPAVMQASMDDEGSWRISALLIQDALPE